MPWTSLPRKQNAARRKQSENGKDDKKQAKKTHTPSGQQRGVSEAAQPVKGLQRSPARGASAFQSPNLISRRRDESRLCFLEKGTGYEPASKRLPAGDNHALARFQCVHVPLSLVQQMCVRAYLVGCFSAASALAFALLLLVLLVCMHRTASAVAEKCTYVRPGPARTRVCKTDRPRPTDRQTGTEAGWLAGWVLAQQVSVLLLWSPVHGWICGGREGRSVLTCTSMQGLYDVVHVVVVVVSVCVRVSVCACVHAACVCVCVCVCLSVVGCWLVVARGGRKEVWWLVGCGETVRVDTFSSHPTYTHTYVYRDKASIRQASTTHYSITHSFTLSAYSLTHSTTTRSTTEID